MGVTALATLGRARRVGWVSLDTVQHVHEVDFIFQVGPISFVVALLAGAAGMLSLVSSKSAALVGVFISVTTVPAAGFAVVAAIVGDWDVAAKSALQLVVNLVGIVWPGSWCWCLRPRAHADSARRRRPELARCGACARRSVWWDQRLWVSRWRWSIAPATRSTDW